MKKLIGISGLSMALAAPAILTAPLLMTGPHANILTGLMPHLWAGLDVVSRELIGMIPSVNRSASVERAAVGQQVSFLRAPAMDAHDNTPAMSVPEPEDHEQDPGFMTITKSKNVNFGFVGEEQRALSTGVGDISLQAQYFAQGLRTLTNMIEYDLLVIGAANASRAWGTPGTTPFGDDKVTASAETARILDDNGAPISGRSLILNTAAGAKVRSNWNLARTNEAGSNMTLRQGEMLDLSGFSVKQTGQRVTVGIGTGAAYTTNNVGYAVGAREIALITGTGTIPAGTLVTFAGDANQYVVERGIAAPGTIRIQEPGLQKAIPAVATNVTPQANPMAVNLGFSQDAIALAARAPALPKEGDMAVDSYVMVDPRSGLAFDVRVYIGYKKVRYEVGIAWGVGAPNPRHIAILAG